MKRLKFILMFVIVALVFLSCAQKSQDWPGWRGENRDAKVIGFQAPDVWPDNLEEVWQITVGLGDAPPSYVDGKLYLQEQQDSNEVALCINAETGDEIWKTVLTPAIVMQGGAASHPGPRGTPQVADGRIFMLGAGGVFSCVDAETGKILWQNTDYTEVPVFYPAASALVKDNMCVIHLGGHDNGEIVAFNVENGEKIWTINGEPSTYSSPVFMKAGGEEIIVLQTETDLFGISLDGSVLFKIPTPGERRFYNSSTPVILGQNVIIAGQGSGTKSFKIEKSGEEYSFTENWHNPELGVSFNTPVLKDGYLYAHESDLGRLFCLDATTGETKWANDEKLDRFALILDLGDLLLSLAATGDLVIYEPNPETYTEVTKYKVTETPVYAHPVVVGNKIFIKDKELLTCWSVK